MLSEHNRNRRSDLLLLYIFLGLVKRTSLICRDYLLVQAKEGRLLSWLRTSSCSYWSCFWQVESFPPMLDKEYNRMQVLQSTACRKPDSHSSGGPISCLVSGQGYCLSLFFLPQASFHASHVQIYADGSLNFGHRPLKWRYLQLRNGGWKHDFDLQALSEIWCACASHIPLWAVLTHIHSPI